MVFVVTGPVYVKSVLPSSALPSVRFAVRNLLQQCVSEGRWSLHDIAFGLILPQFRSVIDELIVLVLEHAVVLVSLQKVMHQGIADFKVSQVGKFKFVL